MFDFLKSRRPVPVLPDGAVRRRYRFFGDVQGVGFRYRAKYAAETLGAHRLGGKRGGRLRHHGGAGAARNHRQNASHHQPKRLDSHHKYALCGNQRQCMGQRISCERILSRL